MEKEKKLDIRDYRALSVLAIIFIDMSLIILMYFIMPKVQNFPPYSEDLGFQSKVQRMTHIQQYSSIFFVGIILHLLAYKLFMNKIDKFIKLYINNKEISYKMILKTRKRCINAPYEMMLMEWILFIGMGLILNVIMLVQVATFIKFTLMIIAVVSLISLFSFIATQKYLSKVLELTYIVNSNYQRKNGIRIKNCMSLLIQSLPFILAMLIIPILMGYSNTVQVKGEGIGSYYKAYLDAIELPDENISVTELKNYLDKIPLKSVNDYYFIITPQDKEIFTSNPKGSISNFVLTYRDYFFKKTNGMLYESFGIEEQLFAKKIVDTNGDAWYIGFKFPVSDTELLISDVYIICIVVALALILLYIWAKNMSGNSDRISKKLKEILESEDIQDTNILPIMSNDELGDLSYYYNKIQERLVKQQDKLIEQQDIISIQSKFAGVGEVAAGMAHDINNPASALDTSVNLLKMFNVTNNKDQYEKLTQNMRVSVDKILNVVNNTQEQFRNSSTTKKENFSLKEMLESLINSEKYDVEKIGGTISLNMEKDFTIYGIKSKLYQVIMNLIRNSVLSYKEKQIKGEIKILAYDDKNDYIISVSDNAGGIPEEIQSSLFKKILTTRGEKGTGLGLYLARGIINSEFNGEITFNTETGEGTTFYIKIPKIEKE